MIFDLKGDERLRIDGQLYEIIFQFSKEHGKAIPHLEETGYEKSDIMPEALEEAV